MKRIESLEPRLLLHHGVDDTGEVLPAWHEAEHQLSAAGANVEVPMSPALLPVALTAADSPSLVGDWGEVLPWPGVAVHSAMMPSGNILFWDYKAQTQLWNPITNTLTNVSDPTFNAFCSGHAFLADGRLLVVGGHVVNYYGLPNAAIYDSSNDTWTNLPDMNEGRWYPNATTLGSGDVSVSGGTNNGVDDYNTLPQVWQADGSGWRDLTTALRAHDYYSETYLTGDGRVFYAGPSNNTFTLNPTGTGSWTEGPTHVLGSRSYGSGAMYEDGKIFIAGGANPPKSTAEVVDLNAATPQWRQVDSMSIARRQIVATILADGQVLITGGTSGAGFNNRETPVYTAELWNPATEQFTTMSAMDNPRWYHATALLLPDGRVMTAGGDDTPSAQVFSPPYLFQGPRPIISSAPDFVTWDQSFTVNTPDAANIARINLIRMGTVTHAFNYDQRIDKLSFTRNGDTLTVTSPAQPNLAPPGYYMMFLIDGNGVPSVAKIMRVGVPAGATQAPFSGSPASIPGVIEAENFDTGGMWVSYRDSTPGNQGSASSRLGEDADIDAISDAGNGKAIVNIAAGEWLEYSINIPAAGAYNLTARLGAGAAEGGTLHVEFDGVDKTGPLALVATDGQWQDVGKAVALEAGVQIVRLCVDSTGAAGFGRFDRITLTSSADQPPTVATAAKATPPSATINVPVAFTVLGADDTGEATLSYSWEAVTRPAGAADPVFSVNVSNAAKQTTATFSSNGVYTIRATITDAAGHSVTSNVVVQIADPLDASLRAIDDAYVRGGTYADDNFGTDSALVVKHGGSDLTNVREAYLRFDLTSLEGGAVTSAKLQLNGAPSVNTQDVPVALHGVPGAVWSEATLTWNNRPPNDPAVLGTALITAADGDHWYEFDVTNFVRSQQLAGATAVTFLVRATADTDAAVIFKSDEYSGNKSLLAVQYTPGGTPPPSPDIVLSASQLDVPEGSQAAFTIKLASQPASEVNVGVTRDSGDSDLSTVLDVPLTFTPENWNTPQDFFIAAVEDADSINGSAAFTAAALGALSKSITVTEVDNDAVTQIVSLPAVADAYVRDGIHASKNFGNDPQLIVKRSANTSNTRQSYLRFSLADIGSVESATLRVFGGLLSSGTAVLVSAYSVSNVSWSESSLQWNNKPAGNSSALGLARSVNSTTRQWYEFDVTSYVKAQRAAGAVAVSFVLTAGTTTDPQAAFDSSEAAGNHPALLVTHTPGGTPPPTPDIVLSASQLDVPEGSQAAFTIKLASQPASEVNVGVTRDSGDSDLSTVLDVPLTFTPENWNTPQDFFIAAVEDADSINGSAAFTAAALGALSKSITVTEVDNDAGVAPVTLRAVADTYVRDGAYAGTNFGSASELQLKKHAAVGYSRESWLRFDLSAFTSATSATLRLFGMLSELMTGGVTVAVYASANTTWSESSLTWDTRPAVATATGSPTFAVSGTTAKWHEVDLTAFVKSELAAGRKAVTLMLRSTTTANAYLGFNSDEASANQPELNVTP